MKEYILKEKGRDGIVTPSEVHLLTREEVIEWLGGNQDTVPVVGVLELDHEQMTFKNITEELEGDLADYAYDNHTTPHTLCENEFNRRYGPIAARG